MKKIGFIGVGIMGESMAHDSTKADYEVATYTRTGSKMGDIISEEAIWCKSTGEYAKGRQAVVSIMGYLKGVKGIYFGEGGIIASAGPGTSLIDMTTTGPRLAVRIYEEAEKTDFHTLNAPATGGDKGAKDGTLTTLAGGDREDSGVYPNILQVMGKGIDYEGRAGNGQHIEMCNQIAIAGTLAGACEAMVYARDVRLNVDTMPKSVSTGAAGSMQMNDVASEALQDDCWPESSIKHSIKDINLADEEARTTDTELRVLEDVLSMYKELEWEGMGRLGTQALIKYYN